VVFEAMVRMLEGIGFFTALAYLLAFMVLYYVFRHALEKGVKRLESPEKRRAASLVLSAAVTALLVLFALPFASDAATYAAAAVFALLFIIIVIAAAGSVLGLDVPGMLRRKGS
jgi:amino acid transporter